MNCGVARAPAQSIQVGCRPCLLEFLHGTTKGLDRYTPKPAGSFYHDPPCSLRACRSIDKRGGIRVVSAAGAGDEGRRYRKQDTHDDPAMAGHPARPLAGHEVLDTVMMYLHLKSVPA